MKINLLTIYKINQKDRKDQMQKDQLGKHPRLEETKKFNKTKQSGIVKKLNGKDKKRGTEFDSTRLG